MSDLPDKNKLDEVRNRATQSQQPPADKSPNPPADKTDPPADPPADKAAEIIAIDKIDEDTFLKEVERRGLKVSKETLSPEAQKKANDIEEADRIKFAVEQGLITPEGYAEVKSILAAEGSDLTKREFTKAYKAENKNATADEIADAYDDYYTVAKTVKVKETKKGTDGFDEEVEVDRPKWDDRHVKWGAQRIQTKGERIKASAKAVLDNINTSYDSYKKLVGRANEYGKDVEKVISETDFAAYPTKHKIENKEYSGIVKFTKPDEVKADVLNYLNTDLAQIVLRTEKNPDTKEIQRQVNAYLKDKYASDFEETIYRLGKTEGLNTGKIGGNQPILREIISDDSRPNELAQEIKDRIPMKKDNPLLNR